MAGDFKLGPFGFFTVGMEASDLGLSVSASSWWTPALWLETSNLVFRLFLMVGMEASDLVLSLWDFQAWLLHGGRQHYGLNSS